MTAGRRLRAALRFVRVLKAKAEEVRMVLGNLLDLKIAVLDRVVGYNVLGLVNSLGLLAFRTFEGISVNYLQGDGKLDD